MESKTIFYIHLSSGVKIILHIYYGVKFIYFALLNWNEYIDIIFVNLHKMSIPFDLPLGIYLKKKISKEDKSLSLQINLNSAIQSQRKIGQRRFDK